ncbi:hypothetical protein ACFPMF_00695 [Larkinella bovis]|uniref:Uncharacterized protein n=1 Tax=Larkinella bovis TaxID=683041 RepID=A0ABW0I5Y6_9BACT
METVETIVETVKQSEIKKPASTKKEDEKGQKAHWPFEVMDPWQKFVRVFFIGFFFLCWLALLFFGLSYDSSYYHDLIFGVIYDPAQEKLKDPAEAIIKFYDFTGQPWKKLPYPSLKHYIIYLLSLTPLNVALLSALSAAIGGLASNLSASNKLAHEWRKYIKPNSAEFRSYVCMTESPAVSMLRGFIVYLLVITGASLTNFTSAIDTTSKFAFAGTSAPAYFKFAVTITLLSYLAGYDSTRLKSLLQTINITKKEEDPSENNQKMLEVIHTLAIKRKSKPDRSHHSKSNNRTDQIGQLRSKEDTLNGNAVTSGKSSDLGAI